MDETVNCVICNGSLNGEGDVVTLKDEGREKINRASAEQFDSLLRSLGSR